MFGTRHGVVKKTALAAYNTPLKERGIAALIIRDDDALVDVRLADEGSRVMMISRNGYCVSFREQDVRAMGRSASGVRGMSLRAGDEVIALRVPREGDSLLVVTEQGFGKRTPVDDYRVKGRGTMGVLTLERQAIARRGALVGALTVADADELMTITASGIVTRQSIADIRQTGRATQGVIVQKLRDEDDRIAAVATIRDPGEANGDELPRRPSCRRPTQAPPAVPADDEPSLARSLAADRAPRRVAGLELLDRVDGGRQREAAVLRLLDQEHGLDRGHVVRALLAAVGRDLRLLRPVVELHLRDAGDLADLAERQLQPEQMVAHVDRLEEVGVGHHARDATTPERSR